MYLPAEAAKIHSFFSSMTEFSVIETRDLIYGHLRWCLLSLWTSAWARLAI